MIFFTTICNRCNVGFGGERGETSDHPKSECLAFQSLRERLGMRKNHVPGQAEMLWAMKYEKKHGMLPELKDAAKEAPRPKT